MTIILNVPESVRQKVLAVLVRAEAAGITSHYDRNDQRQRLEVCHANGCPLDFDKLLQSDEATLRSDLYGIQQNIDFNTGKLRNSFVPSCAVSNAAE